MILKMVHFAIFLKPIRVFDGPVPKDYYVGFATMRNIVAGEEILWDYGNLFDKVFFFYLGLQGLNTNNTKFEES